MERRLSAILAADIAGYSRLMGEDEDGTVQALQGHQTEVLPLVAKFGGRIIDTAGDGILAEFPSVIAAVECATDIQVTMARRNAEVPENRRMLFRIGINLGDLIHDGARIYGDGINVAARLEGIAEPGGICISRQVFEQVDRALDMVFNALGPRNLKNIARPVDVYAVDWRQRLQPSPQGPGKAVESPQDVRFCRTADGVQLAYSAIGAGPPLVKTGNWMTHLEYDLESPIWRHVWRALAREHTLIRYDTRGNGLSDWEADDISFDAFVSRSGNSLRGDQARTLCHAGDITRLCSVHRLCGAASGTCVAPCPLRRLRARPGQAPKQRESAGGGRRHADVGTVGVGQGESCFPATVHVAVRAGRDQGTGGLV